jgi:hypothetical protein
MERAANRRAAMIVAALPSGISLNYQKKRFFGKYAKSSAQGGGWGGRHPFMGPIIGADRIHADRRGGSSTAIDQRDGDRRLRVAIEFGNVASRLDRWRRGALRKLINMHSIF